MVGFVRERGREVNVFVVGAEVVLVSGSEEVGGTREPGDGDG